MCVCVCVCVCVTLLDARFIRVRNIECVNGWSLLSPGCLYLLGKDLLGKDSQGRWIEGE